MELSLSPDSAMIINIEKFDIYVHNKKMILVLKDKPKVDIQNINNVHKYHHNINYNSLDLTEYYYKY
jgi:hypothetical protein